MTGIVTPVGTLLPGRPGWFKVRRRRWFHGLNAFSGAGFIRHAHDDPLHHCGVLDTGIVAIRVFSCVPEGGVVPRSGGNLLRNCLFEAILIRPRDATEQIVEVGDDMGEQIQLGLPLSATALSRRGMDRSGYAWAGGHEIGDGDLADVALGWVVAAALPSVTLQAMCWPLWLMSRWSAAQESAHDGGPLGQLSEEPCCRCGPYGRLLACGVGTVDAGPLATAGMAMLNRSIPATGWGLLHGERCSQ